MVKCRYIFHICIYNTWSMWDFEGIPLQSTYVGFFPKPANWSRLNLPLKIIGWQPLEFQNFTTHRKLDNHRKFHEKKIWFVKCANSSCLKLLNREVYPTKVTSRLFFSRCLSHNVSPPTFVGARGEGCGMLDGANLPHRQMWNISFW